MERRLAAILAADVVGYSRLIEADEMGTLSALAERHSTVLEPLLAQHRGRIVKLMGDGVLAEFGSAVNAVQCAIELQKRMAEVNATLPDRPAIVWRIGINLGDVVIDDLDIKGDGVNVAARLEAMADPGGICISAGVFEQAEMRIPVVYEDLGEQALKNISRPVRVYRVTSGAEVSRINRSSPTRTKAAIAVLPFVNMSEDASQVYFSDGITEDIITELSRFRDLFVVARTSSFAFREMQIGAAEIGRRLGVRYLVEGSVRRSGDRVRITAQLIDATSGAHCWAERYDRKLDDIFEVQDEVAATIVVTLAGRIQAAHTEQAKRKPPSSLAAYDCLLQGLENLSGYEEGANAKARALFEQAIAIDPTYALAHAYLGLVTYMQSIRSDRSGLERAVASARRGLALDDQDSRCHRILAEICLELHQFDQADLHSDRSLQLNPNDAHAAAYRAYILMYLGAPEAALEWINKALRLNPLHPAWYSNTFARVLHALGRYEEAIAAYDRIGVPRADDHAYLAACHAKLGHADEARQRVERAIADKPDLSARTHVAALPFKHERDRARLLDELLKAGLPE